MRTALAFSLFPLRLPDRLPALARGMASALIAALLCCSVIAPAAAQNTQYIVTNDDVAPQLPNSMSFYTVGANGTLTLQQRVVTSGYGIAGGYFGTNRISVLDSGSTGCIYASEAATGDIVGIVVSTLTIGGTAVGSPTDTGTSNGIGLVMNSQYLYAGFTDTSTIGTFQVQPGCTLSFIGDTTVGGLQGGIIEGMAINGTLLVATYGDGSIESFDISSGMPVSNGDKQNSTAFNSSNGATYPTDVDITQDGHFAIFGDTSMSAVVEVSDIASGHLTTPVAYTSLASINSSNILLSPDETLLYVVDTQGDQIGAAFFNKTTGVLTSGCISGQIRGYSQNWSYLSGLAFATTTGTGGGVYIAEYGAPSSIAMVQVTSGGGKCSLQEAPNSPVADPNSGGLLSLGAFPPRPF